jgi:hypothetical protein
MSIKWGLSVLDWRDHASNDHHDHPTGVYKVQCGHSLMMSHPTAGHIVRDSMPGVRRRNRRYGSATLRAPTGRRAERESCPVNAASSRVLPGGRSVPTR